MRFRGFKKRKHSEGYNRELVNQRIVITHGQCCDGPLLDVSIEELYLIWKFGGYAGSDYELCRKIELGNDVYLELKDPGK